MLVCLVTFLVMFLPRPRQLTALGKEGMYVEDQQATESPSPYLGGKRRRGRSLSQEGEEVYQQPGSYMGFHRPLGVVPPSSSPPHTKKTNKLRVRCSQENHGKTWYDVASPISFPLGLAGRLARSTRCALGGKNKKNVG